VVNVADGYQVLFDANPRPMWVADQATMRIVLVNDAAIGLYGWSRDELLAMTLRDLRPPEERAGFQTAYDASKSTPTYSRFGKHWKKSGEIIEVHLEITHCTWQGETASFAIVTNVTGIEDMERRLRLLVEHSADGISLTSEDGILEYISPGGARLFGYSPQQMIGSLSKLRAHPEDAATWTRPTRGETRSNLVRAQVADGSWRWFESTTTNLTHDPAIRALVSNFRDITDRIAHERAIVDSQRRLEYLMSATSSITYSALGQGDFDTTFISSNVRDILGHTPEDFTSEARFWVNNVHPDDLPQLHEGLRMLFERGEHTRDYRFRHRDGSYRWMRDVARVVRDDAGNPVEVVGYWIDITDQVRAQASLLRSETNFRALIEHSPLATFVHRQGRYVYVNPAAVALFGYERAEDIIGRPALDLTHPDDRENAFKRMQQTVETGSTPRGEARMIRRDGSTVALELEGIRLDFDGEPSNVVIARDITERHEMFARMALADRMLTVGTLAAGVAHEINNPLAYVAMNLEIVARALPHGAGAHSELPALVADAREGVARVSSIVRDLRALARPEHDVRGPVDLSAVLASSIKMAHNEIRHRARVVEHYERDLPSVLADSSRLGQVLLNLLMNAAQAIEEGHADRNEIRIRAARDGVDHVIVEVEDTGAGIPAAVQSRIFDPFFTTKAPGAAMGLGLAISHQIVNAMDGEITVNSTPGAGTTFRVRLRAAHQAPATRALQAQPPGVRGTRILLVDDEAAVGRSLVALLGPELDVVAVTSARQAIDELASGEPFDVVLCDLMMPEISGIELYEQIAPRYRERVIFITGGAFTPQARQFLARTDRPRLDKPFSESALREAIRRVVAGH
jgi:PAS domain S-box-containing protein